LGLPNRGDGRVEVVWPLNEGAALPDVCEPCDGGSPLTLKKSRDRGHAGFLIHKLDCCENGYLGPGHCSQGGAAVRTRF